MMRPFKDWGRYRGGGYGDGVTKENCKFQIENIWRERYFQLRLQNADCGMEKAN